MRVLSGMAGSAAIAICIFTASISDSGRAAPAVKAGMAGGFDVVESARSLVGSWLTRMFSADTARHGPGPG
ncbi:hypothetical protein MWN34_10290 [Ancylobacter sp. 6x-1]|uniref:Uncharacterized protein n=1 Tax=Ancylobacter crimeensis TaxID=2579147 RepID=A0ABT0DBI2_9HYPH|nr:hypothetical protein [Ancylobacter crimeensis]MCK0197300.1 hypothetical protein [Ancylobacter crimeensis]